MSQHDEETERAPLLYNGNLSHTHIISGNDEDMEHGSKARVRIKYIPKVSLFSPQKLVIVLCVLVVELCERMTYYGVAANFILFCTSNLDYSSNSATTLSLVFSGTTYLIPIFGGFISDAWSSKFNVILGSSLIYLCGLFLVVCAAIDYTSLFGDPKYVLETSDRRIFYILGLVLIAMGTGGIKANVGPFGAQQVQDLGAEAVQVFFNWFYWFVNAGALIAFSAIAYVQQNVGFAWGFLIPFLSMVLALIILNIARAHYVNRSGQGSVLITSFKICGAACCRKSPHEGGRCRTFDSARKEFGGDFDSLMVDGVIAVLRLLPIFFFVIMFWAINSQMQSTYYLQGERMDLSIGSAQIPVAMLNVFNTVAIMVFIPILDRCIYPCFRRLGRPLTYLQRIGIGFILSACSVFVAGWLEIDRKQELGFNQKVGDETFYAANITVFLQAPQFMLVGAGEAFTSIAGLEFAYTQAPKNLQGLVMGVFLATSGVGNYISSAIIAIIEATTKDDPWFPNDINDGKAEYVFFVFGGLMILFFIGYVPTALWYKYQEFVSDWEATISSNQAPNKRQTNIGDDSITVV